MCACAGLNVGVGWGAAARVGVLVAWACGCGRVCVPVAVGVRVGLCVCRGCGRMWDQVGATMLSMFVCELNLTSLATVEVHHGGVLFDHLFWYPLLEPGIHVFCAPQSQHLWTRNDLEEPGDQIEPSMAQERVRRSLGWTKN